MAEDHDRAEINRLYWESDASVAAIADRLGVSRRALYDSIDPQPAGTDCPECGTPLGFRNRTAAENREASCPACGLELALTGADEGAPAAGDQGPAAGAATTAPDTAEPEVEQEDRAARLTPFDVRRVPAGRGRGGAVVGGVLLAGLAAGVVAGLVLRRR